MLIAPHYPTDGLGRPRQDLELVEEVRTLFEERNLYLKSGTIVNLRNLCTRLCRDS